MLPPSSAPVPPLPSSLRSLIAVDEGLDRILRFSPAGGPPAWTLPLREKCRSLQLLPGANGGTVLAVTGSGFMEIDASLGTVVRTASPFPRGGVISAQRLADGDTFFGGLGLGDAPGVTFVRLDAQHRPVRSVYFGGDYVRRSTLTADNTILFTCDGRVLEGDWSGRILREFSAPGFRHAWKAVRLDDDRTLISAGYGAFAAEFAGDGRLLRRWECTAHPHRDQLRPHFFGDFTLLPDGGLLVCNWLGHGTDLGATGYSLLRFDPLGRLDGAWQNAALSSSLQTFVLPDENH